MHGAARNKMKVEIHRLTPFPQDGFTHMHIDILKRNG